MNLDNTKLYVGIDASFAGTGLVIINNECNIVYQRLIGTKKINEFYDIEKRIIFISNTIIEELSKFENIKLILIEDISYGSTGDGAAQLSALNYFIRIALLNNKYEYGTVAPTKLKQFASGKGQSKKNMMLKEVFKRWNEDFDDDNICDAYVLARIAQSNFNKNK